MLGVNSQKTMPSIFISLTFSLSLYPLIYDSIFLLKYLVNFSSETIFSLLEIFLFGGHTWEYSGFTIPVGLLFEMLRGPYMLPLIKVTPDAKQVPVYDFNSSIGMFMIIGLTFNQLSVCWDFPFLLDSVLAVYILATSP